jgi:plastocyanin
VRARKTVGAGLIVVTSLGLVGCGSSDKDPNADVKIKREATKRFDPDELQITLNRETSFSFYNDDDTVHNVTIPAMFTDDKQTNIDVDIPKGQRISITIPAQTEAPRDGFWLFYCKYHQAQGMTGRITISK